MTESIENLTRVMAIMAHADDAEFGYAGTIAKWVRQGKEVTYVLVTNGNKGSADPNITHEQLVELRKAEQLAAAEVLGVKEVVFMGYPDGELEHTLGLRRDLTRVVRQHKPDIAIVPDPTTWYFRDNYINHPDHRAVGEAALAAIYPSARDRLTFPELLAEGLEPHKVQDVYITVSNELNSWVDISETIEIKIAALREHKSQLSDPEAVEKMVREWAEFGATGLEVRYAERFRRITLR
jgi:LmbE family N-acetylglucosaminyl deacetylase